MLPSRRPWGNGLRLLACALLCLAPEWALAAGEHGAEEHEAAPIPFDSQLTLRAAFEAARERHPALGLVGAQARRADAEDRYAGRWLPDAPQASGYHLSDQPLDDRGLYEDEIALSFPVWMPGEKRARQRMAEAVAAAAQAGAEAFDWRVSAELRETLWGLLQARRRWDLASEQEANLGAVLEQARRYEEAGEISRGDALSVEQELGSWRAETLRLEAEWQDAARGYRALTGLEVLPAEFREQRSQRTAIGDDHPALRQARDRLAEASAHYESMRRGNNYRPSLQVFWRNNRPDALSPADSALGIGFEVPLGRSPSRGPEVALADEAVELARAQLLQQQRELQLQLHEAEHELHTIERQLENSDALMEAAESRHQMDRLERDVGEIDVQEWLRRLARYNEIRRDHELLVLRHGAAIAAYNQAVGETP